MNSVIMGFSRPKTWKPFAWLIMTAYNIPYDHVYIKIYSSKYQRALIYQASSTMVNFMGADIFDANNTVVKEFQLEISDDNAVKLMQFAIDNAGKPYGLKEIFGLAVVRIAELCGKSIKNPFKDNGSTYVCSELAAYILQEYMQDKLPKDFEDMTPLDVYNYLSSLKTQ